MQCIAHCEDGNTHYRVGICSMQGHRDDMEDTHIMHLEFTKHRNASLFGLFDGHGGPNASQYLKDNLYKQLNAMKCDDFNCNHKINQIIAHMDRDFCVQSGNDGSTILFAIVL